MTLPSITREYRVSKRGLGSIDALTLISDVPVPTPVANDVLVKIRAVSLNYRDLMLVLGLYPGAKENTIPCSDAAGEVVAVGDRVTKWKVGDRVTVNFSTAHLHGDITPAIMAHSLGANADGTLTEYRSFPAEAVVSIPDHLTFEQAATLPCAGVTAWNALQGPVPLKGGDYVLVQGTGGVSVFGIQFAHALGATIIATSSSNEKLKVAKKLGADFVINYKENPDWEQDVLKITDGRGVDHIIEVGGTNTIIKSIKAVRHAGWIHNIGFLAGFDSDVKPAEITGSLLFKGAIFRGILVGSVSQFEDMNRLISSHKIVPVVDKVFEFAEAKEAYKYLESQKHVGKVVIRVASN
ncbi:hypothetical protein EUX98_g7800 [Antrodiella citrinella]|uniref:Enoyl reductase (ER) domain-containing protein n=1 Tax=Antrodiella citrinella TaxID=2447956 RepID=A0A4S4MKY2_9APHY|nr:hypothetical protein EUX98_g7800 [Antrodiella citrinella]